MVKVIKGGTEVKNMSDVKLPQEVVKVIKTSVQN